MRRVLVIGSAGFLMSNFIRYVLYRTKEYEFFSIDKLDGADFRNVYQNRRHSFHIGNAGDPALIGKMMSIVDPGIVVMGTSATGLSHVSGIEDIVMPAAAVCDAAEGRLVIRLSPETGIHDKGRDHMWLDVESMVESVDGTVLRIPICFGRRGHGGFEEGLRRIALGQMSGWEPSMERRRCAYAEDVASMVWYLMEQPRKGIVHMPSLAEASTYDMLSMTSGIHGLYMEPQGPVAGPEPSTVEGWSADSPNVEEAARSTAKWHMLNRWFLQ
jgi:hypothetical protein